MEQTKRLRHSRRGGPTREHMRIRRQLMELILEIIRRDDLCTSTLANCLYTSRTRASTLVHGHIERFNSETLIDMLARLGVDVDITVTRRRGYLRGYVSRPRPNWKPFPGYAHG
jgi:predicted XRE-type DNA-binding protein